MAQNRIPVSHVGGLIRPAKLIEFNTAIAEGKAYDSPAYEACLTASVAEVVRRQADADVDIVSDDPGKACGSRRAEN